MMNDIKNKLKTIVMMIEVADNQSASDIVIVCRQVLEKCIDLIFEIKNVKKPVSASLLELINHEVVKDYLDSELLKAFVM